MTGWFSPDWCIAPAATLREWMKELGGMTPAQLAKQAGRGEADIKALLCIQDVLALQPYGEAAAEVLERGTGVGAALWLALEQNYREGLAAGLIDITPQE